MENSAVGSNNYVVFIVGLLGSGLSVAFDRGTPEEVMDFWHFIPGLFSIAFITYRWAMDVKDRKKKNK